MSPHAPAQPKVEVVCPITQRLVDLSELWQLCQVEYDGFGSVAADLDSIIRTITCSRCNCPEIEAVRRGPFMELLFDLRDALQDMAA